MSRNIPRRHTHDAGDIVSGRLRLGLLGTGTPSADTFLRGDGAWSAVPGGGGVGASGSFVLDDGTATAGGAFVLEDGAA